MQTTPASGARKNSQLRSTAIRLASASWRAIPIEPYTNPPSSRAQVGERRAAVAAPPAASTALPRAAPRPAGHAPDLTRTPPATAARWSSTARGSPGPAPRSTSCRGTGLSRRNSPDGPAFPDDVSRGRTSLDSQSQSRTISTVLPGLRCAARPLSNAARPRASGKVSAIATCSRPASTSPASSASWSRSGVTMKNIAVDTRTRRPCPPVAAPTA